MASRLWLFLPLFLFTVLALFLFRGLSLDPRELPSALVDKPLPAFTLTDLKGQTRTREDIVGQVSLVNVWATWCPSCRVEHPYLQTLAASGVRLFGINYKDEDGPARQWLEDLGDPYQFSVADREGTLGLDMGVYGAPETYLIDAAGIVRYRHVGVVDERVWSTILAPRYHTLENEAK